MRRYLVIGLALSAIGGTSLHAQSAASLSPDQIIAARQAMMDLQSATLGAMKTAVEAKAEVKPLTDSAKALAASAKVIPSLFPPGTEKGHDTKAKPGIWSNHADFAKDADNLEQAAQKLVQLAEANDKDGFASQFAATGRACGACHREYKER